MYETYWELHRMRRTGTPHKYLKVDKEKLNQLGQLARRGFTEWNQHAGESASVETMGEIRPGDMLRNKYIHSVLIQATHTDTDYV